MKKSPHQILFLLVGFTFLFFGGFFSGKAYALLGGPVLLATSGGELIMSPTPSPAPPKRPKPNCYRCGTTYGSCIPDRYGDFSQTCHWSLRNGVEICTTNTDACIDDINIVNN
jgi:hypothetical protein